MRILFIAETLTYGGVARRFIELGNALSERGFDITLYVYNGSIELRDKIDKSIKCIVEQSIGEMGNWLYRNTVYKAKCIKHISCFLDENKFDVILSFNDMVNLSLLLCRNTHKSKIVISERSDPNYNKRYLQFIKELLFRGSDGIVFQTKGAQDFFGKKIRDKSIVIPNPIPSGYKFERYIGERDKEIVTVSRLWLYQKRQDLLIQAFNNITNRYPDYKLVFYGDGQDEATLKNMVMQLGLESKVIFAGVTGDVFTSIKKASLFVLSSDFEGIPNALIEAMSMGLPVISTDCSPGGAKLLINNNENGLLVPCGNVRALTDAIEYMLSNPNRATEMGSEALSIVYKFNERGIYDDWAQYIEQVGRYEE